MIGKRSRPCPLTGFMLISWGASAKSLPWRPAPRHHREKEKDQRTEHLKTSLGPLQASRLTSTRMSQSLRKITASAVPFILTTDTRRLTELAIKHGRPVVVVLAVEKYESLTGEQISSSQDKSEN